MRRIVLLVTTGALWAWGCANLGPARAPAGPQAGPPAGWTTGTTARGAVLGAVVGGAGGAAIGKRMDRQADSLRMGLEGVDVVRLGEGVVVTFDVMTLFPENSSSLSQDGQFRMHKLADSLMGEGRTVVLVLAHTDSEGATGSGQLLTEERGARVVSYLHSQGLDLARLESRGRGAAEPLDPEGSEASHGRNRRVEVAVYASSAWQEEARRAGPEGLDAQP